MNGLFREGDKGKFKEQISHITSPIFLFVVAVLVFIEEIYEGYIKKKCWEYWWLNSGPQLRPATLLP